MHLPLLFACYFDFFFWNLESADKQAAFAKFEEQAEVQRCSCLNHDLAMFSRLLSNLQ